MNSNKILQSILILTTYFMFVGCANKNMFNQTDEFWYKEIIESINKRDMDKADESFSSLEAEHINSPLLETATLLLIQSHIKQENYILANYYMDRFNTLFGTKQNRSYIEYLRVKSKYLAFKRPKRDQKLIFDTLELITDYIVRYPNSIYLPYINTIKTNLSLSQHELNIDIIILYKKLDKPKAVEFYKKQENMSWIKEDEIQKPEISFIRSLFE